MTHEIGPWTYGYDVREENPVIAFSDDAAGSDVGRITDELRRLGKMPDEDVERLQVGGLARDDLKHGLLQLLAVRGYRALNVKSSA